MVAKAEELKIRGRIVYNDPWYSYIAGAVEQTNKTTLSMIYWIMDNKEPASVLTLEARSAHRYFRYDGLTICNESDFTSADVGIQRIWDLHQEDNTWQISKDHAIGQSAITRRNGIKRHATDPALSKMTADYVITGVFLDTISDNVTFESI